MLKNCRLILFLCFITISHLSLLNLQQQIRNAYIDTTPEGPINAIKQPFYSDPQNHINIQQETEFMVKSNQSTHVIDNLIYSYLPQSSMNALAYAIQSFQLTKDPILFQQIRAAIGFVQKSLFFIQSLNEQSISQFARDQDVLFFRKGKTGSKKKTQFDVDSDETGDQPIVGCLQGLLCKPTQQCRYNMCIEKRVLEKIDKTIKQKNSFKNKMGSVKQDDNKIVNSFEGIDSKRQQRYNSGRIDDQKSQQQDTQQDYSSQQGESELDIQIVGDEDAYEAEDESEDAEQGEYSRDSSTEFEEEGQSQVLQQSDTAQQTQSQQAQSQSQQQDVQQAQQSEQAQQADKLSQAQSDTESQTQQQLQQQQPQQQSQQQDTQQSEEGEEDIDGESDVQTSRQLSSDLTNKKDDKSRTRLQRNRNINKKQSNVSQYLNQKQNKKNQNGKGRSQYNSTINGKRISGKQDKTKKGTNRSGDNFRSDNNAVFINTANRNKKGRKPISVVTRDDSQDRYSRNQNFLKDDYKQDFYPIRRIGFDYQQQYNPDNYDLNNINTINNMNNLRRVKGNNIVRHIDYDYGDQLDAPLNGEEGYLFDQFGDSIFAPPIRV